jgi:pimeloyl-ACP methyl ester carboxylesterase
MHFRFLALLLAPLSLPGQVQDLTFVSSVDGTSQPYALYLPPNFDAAQKYPLILSLHSEDTNHRLNLRQVLGPPNRMGRPLHEDARFLIASPYARGAMGYQGIAEQDVYDMLAAIESHFPVDPDRIYLTGASMGGGGALWLALTHPDLWAAVAPVCPAGIPGSEDLAPNLLNLGVRFYHGEQDTIVPVAASRAWQRRLLDLNIPAGYIEYPGVPHNAWDLAYRNGAAFDWLAQFRRQRFPDHVHFVTRAYRYDAAYWVRIDGLTPGTLAEIDVRRTGAAAAVETHNLEGFTLTPDRPLSSVTIDGAPVRLPRPALALSFVKTGGRWTAGKFQPVGKRPGAEGPIVEALLGRPLFVYGSLGTQTADEIEERHKVAERAAAWKSTRMRVDFAPAVKVDSEVTDADLATHDLVLFGTARTNLMVARFATALPLALDPGAADYGLLAIVPAGRHYVLVNSGLPWWTGAEDSAPPASAIFPEALRQLAGLGDYVLFKGSLAHVVAEGRFDRNWKLPAAEAARLAASGTVSIH